jgi:signal transduction histidine kinase
MTEQDKETADGSSQKGTSAETGSEDTTRALLADYEARLDEVAELVARVRHEINNPLAGVLGQAQLLLREELSDKARKRAQTIEELALRLRDIVGQLRQIQKPLKSSGDDESSSVGALDP